MMQAVKHIAVAGMAFALMGSSAMAESQQACQDRWLQSEKAGITYGEKMIDRVPTVMVDEQTWSSIDYATKVGMARTFNCAVAGPDKTLTKVEFVSNMTFHVLGRWEVGKGLTVIDP